MQKSLPLGGRLFFDDVNRHRGNATLVELPEIGINGNTHALTADKNNLDVAKHLMCLLRQKGLDTGKQPHAGPAPLKLGSATIPLE